MYDELDIYLTECSTENSSDDYWYDIGFEYASQIIEKFDKIDWMKLEQQLDEKNDAWEKRLIYCLGNKDVTEELDIIIKLSNTLDDELFIMCIDALRELINNETKRKIDSFNIVERVRTLIPQRGIASQTILNRFIQQINEQV